MESDWLMVILFIMYYIQIGNNRRKINELEREIEKLKGGKDNGTMGTR